MSGSFGDPWRQLRSRTSARIALGRAGVSLPTREVLSFALAHAQARDAVHATLDRKVLAETIQALGLEAIEIESMTTERAQYLRRPDLGRRLSDASKARLAARAGVYDLALMIGDGLSATAVAAQSPPLLKALLPLVTASGLTIAPVTVAHGARVALGDEVGELLGASMVAVLIGERPGLSAADSLGIYLTYAPRAGRSDAERNCISNVRPEGLAPAAAAQTLAWLISAARERKLTGVGLKDESPAPALAPPGGPSLMPD